MRLSEFFEKAGTKQIVINTDIDGFLSGMLLCKYYNCEVVGFSDSRNTIWLRPDITSIKQPIYIDIFFNDKDVYCIDQHIIAVDTDHANLISEWGTKMNPNLDVSTRTFLGEELLNADYFHKYPFGTVHYLIALMKQDGIDVKFGQLKMVQHIPGNDGKMYDVSIADLLLRADDTMYNSRKKYCDNALNWWYQLLNFSEDDNSEPSRLLTILCRYLYDLKIEDIDKIKETTDTFFLNGLGCDGSDGGFNAENVVSNGLLSEKIIGFNVRLGLITGCYIKLPISLVTYKGTIKLCGIDSDKWKSSDTYAFVRSPKSSNKSSCISYTLPFRKEVEPA